MIDETDEEKFGILDDGFYRRRHDEEEKAEPEANGVLLGDALQHGELALPSTHSPEIAAILAAPDTPEHRAARQQRLDNINRLLVQSNTEDKDNK